MGDYGRRGVGGWGTRDDDVFSLFSLSALEAGLVTSNISELQSVKISVNISDRSPIRAHAEFHLCNRQYAKYIN